MTITRPAMLIGAGVLLVAFIVWDALAATDREYGNTFSEIVLAWAMARPLGVLLAGILLGTVLGHVFWPQMTPCSVCGIQRAAVVCAEGHP